MTYIIIGLGDFGAALGERLTANGHDVIAVDSNMNLVEEYKNRISSTICLNVAEAASLKMLPLADADEVIVSFGEDVGASLLVVALLKQHGVKCLKARAGSRLHRAVLEAIGVDEVLMPEINAAELFALSAERTEVKGAYLVTDNQQIVEIEIPTILSSQSLSQANLTETFNVKIIGVKRQFTRKSLIGKTETFYEMADIEAPTFRFAEHDRLLLFGDIADLQKMKRKLF